MPSQFALIRLPEVIARTGKGRSSIYRDIAAGTFPEPVSISRRAVAWHVSDIEAWIAARPFAASMKRANTRRRRASGQTMPKVSA